MVISAERQEYKLHVLKPLCSVLYLNGVGTVELSTAPKLFPKEIYIIYPTRGERTGGQVGFFSAKANCQKIYTDFAARGI
jgi:hypothetical protein